MSTSGTRTLKILKALKGHSLNGVSNGDLAKSLNDTPANISRSLDTLIKEGLAMKLDNGRFALSVQTLQIATAHAIEMDKANHRINELNQRILAGASDHE